MENKTGEIKRKNPRIEERPSKDQYFINLCKQVAQRSLDPNTQVGCVLTDNEGRVIATGYNSYPANCNDESLPFERPDKYPYMAHAEQNAIGAAVAKHIQGFTVYIPFYPCPSCFCLLAACGVKEIKYFEDYESGVNKNEAVELMAKQIGISIIRLEDNND